MVWSSDVDHKHILVVNKPAHIQLPAFVLLHTHGSYNGAQTRDLQVTVDESAARETSPDELRHRPCRQLISRRHIATSLRTGSSVLVITNRP